MLKIFIAEKFRLMSAAAAIFMISSAATAQESSQPPMQRLTLSATASSESAHDWLQMRLGSQREGSDAATVQRQLKADVDSALQQLRPQAEPGQFQVSSGPFALNPRYGKDGKPNGWQGAAELILEGRDVARISQAAGAVPTLVLLGLQFSLSPQARASMEAELQAQAIERFKTKAQNAAQSFGFKGFQLVQVQVGSTDQGGGGVRPYMAMAPRMAAADAAPIPVEPGRTQVQLTVSGTVQLR